jgi:hypothetical protein
MTHDDRSYRWLDDRPFSVVSSLAKQVQLIDKQVQLIDDV